MDHTKTLEMLQSQTLELQAETRKLRVIQLRQRRINLALLDWCLQTMQIASNLTSSVADPAVRQSQVQHLKLLSEKFNEAFSLVKDD